MRTKNGKWIGSVPITLVAVFALAAFLSVGFLLIGNDGQVAEAQDASCEIMVGADAQDVPAPDPGTQPCTTTDDPATVGLPGSLTQGSDGEITAYIFAKDGTIAGGSSVRLVEPGANLGDADDPTPVDVKHAIVLDIDAATYNLSTSNVERSEGMVSVTPNAGESVVTLYIYYGTAPESVGINHDADGDTDDVNQLPTTDLTVAITFLGDPALGKDSDNDINRIVDDVMQCQDSSDTEMKAERMADGQCPTTHTDTDNADAPESRSKIIAWTENLNNDVVTTLIDSSSDNHVLMNNLSEATIYAVIQDAAGRPLEDAEVTFTASVEPMDLDIDLRLVRDVDVQIVGDDDGELNVAAVEGIEDLDTVAARTINDLPIGDASYRITVQVSAGSLDLGSIVLTRTGSAEAVVAGVFNADCLDGVDFDAEELDFTNATVNLKNDDCDDSGMLSRFGRGELVVVKAHLEDSLGSVVGESTDLASELADEFDDPLIDGDPVIIANPVPPNTMPKAWVYEIDMDAQLGDHDITVSTTAKNADDEDVGDVTLTVSVAGPPTQYMFVDLVDNIELGGRATFTVQAYDANNGAPHFSKNDADMYTDNTVEVVVPDIAQSLVRGSELLNGVLTLDADTGMGSFTIYAPANVTAGSTARIFVSAGDVEITHTVTFGDPGAMPPTDPMDDMFTAMYTVMADSPSSGMVEVSWVTTQPISLVMLMDDQGMVAAWDVALLALGSSAQFSGIQAGEYQVVVFSLTAGDFSNGGLAFGSVTVE